MSMGGGALSTTAYYFLAYFFASSMLIMELTFSVLFRIRWFAYACNYLITGYFQILTRYLPALYC